MNAEQKRIDSQKKGIENWRLWGPYLAERAWGTVREDYSPYGTSWDYFDHDQARSRAYRWNEDGLGGICDEEQRLCLGLSGGGRFGFLLIFSLSGLLRSSIATSLKGSRCLRRLSAIKSLHLSRQQN